MSITTTNATTTGSLTGYSGFHHKRIAWAAIFAGLLVALGIQLLLALLGIGIGMGAVNPMRDNSSMANLGMGALLWWALTFLVSLFVGGWVSGRLSRTGNRFETRIHGVLTWVTFVLVNVYVLTSVAGSAMNTTAPVSADKNSTTVQNQPASLNTNGNASQAANRQRQDEIAADVSKAAIYSFVGLLLGAIIATIGSTMGRGNRYDDYDEIETTKRGSDYIAPRRPISPSVG